MSVAEPLSFVETPAADTAPAPRPSRERYDVVVIGGGPGGSTAATLLAKAGKSVLLLERDRFPRFRIGESMLPMSRQIFERLGVAEQMEATFIRKYGAHFVKGDGSREQMYEFSTAIGCPYEYAYHVTRADFDRILLENARKAGVEVIEGRRVEEALFEGDPLADGRAVGVLSRAEGEEAPVETRSAFVVDASGRWSVIGKKLRLRVPDVTLNKAAVFAHFTGVTRLEGRHEGSITIATSDEGWFWIIPFKGDRTSVGAVMHHAFWRERKEKPEEMFRLAIERCKPVRERLASAVRVSPVETEGSFSYRCDRFAGNGWVLCGDAAAFLDPIFSSGVLLTMRCGEQISDAIGRGLERGDVSRELFRGYERRMRSGMGVFWRFIYGFYDASFLEMFMQPTARFGLQGSIAGILAGNIFPSFRVQLRIWLMALIVGIARRVFRLRGRVMPDRAGA